jgi:putative DNA primase/helicase
MSIALADEDRAEIERRNAAAVLFKLHTELEAAHFFAGRNRDAIRYCEDAGGWYAWDGRRWRRDRDEVARLAHDTAFAIADSAEDLKDLELRKKRIGFAVACQRRRGVEAMMALAQPLQGITLAETALDASPWLLNVANGTIDLRDGVLHAHRRDALLTKLADVEFDPNAQATRWLRFLDEIFAGDQETIAFLQRAIGYSLTGDVREQCFFVLHGIGANGKSTLLTVLARMLSDYGMSTAPETFVDRKGGAPTNDLARLRGARLVSAVETNEGRTLAEGFVKAVTGGDRISVRFLFREFFELQPQFKLWLGTNHKPTIRGGDEGIWRRVRLIPFEQRFEGDRCDPNLRAKLEEELPGILSWAVRGCLQWQQHGLGDSPAIASATRAYRAEMDSFATFLEDRCELDPTASVGAGELFNAFRSWAEANGEKPLSQKWLSLRLTERGFEAIRTKHQRRWKGLSMTQSGDG